MIIIVGLGNPGEKYEKTRHNIGFLTVNSLQLTVNKFSDWRKKGEFQTEISQGKIDDKKVILAKPLTFMNLSGKSVKLLTKTYNLEPKNLIIIHDDIDLPLGKIKITAGRGAAGHKGVESIIKAINSKNFIRFRIGIQPKIGKPKNPEDFVLEKFNKGEEKAVREAIKRTVEAVEATINEGLEKAMSRYNI